MSDSIFPHINEGIENFLLKCLNPQLCWGELSKTYRV